MTIPKLEHAKTGRSTCRGCGEGIAVGELRVGIEAFVAGRVADTWQHPKCALEHCFLEVAPANRGKCKATDEPFAKGDVRLALCSKDHKTFYGLRGLGDALRPILDAVDDFGGVSEIKGFTDLDDETRAQVFTALGVDDDANAGAKKRSKRSNQTTSVSVAEVTLAKTTNKAGGKTELTLARTTRGARAAVGTPAAKATPKAPVAESPPGDGLTEFEREREAHIARNKLRMQALHIGTLAAEIETAATKTGPIQRGIGAKRKAAPKAEPGPLRRSGRVRNEAPDPNLAGGIDLERRDGTVLLANGTSTGGWNGEIERGPSRPEGPVSLASINGDESADEAFINFLRDHLGAPLKESGDFKTGTFLTAGAFNKSFDSVSKTNAKKGELAFPPTSAAGVSKSKLTLMNESVAKVVPRGVTHLDMAPYDPGGPVLVGAGDKDGNIGLWRVDNDGDGAAKEDGDGSEDGVLYFKPHGSYVCHLKWGRGGLAGKLITAAYDGAVRALDIEQKSFVELFATEDEDEFSACDVSIDGRTIHLTDNRGNYQVVDARSGKIASPAVQLHQKKINTIHLEPGAERTIATSCGDQTVCVWDVRKTGQGAKPLSLLQHSKSCQAAYFSPDGKGSLLTTCYDDLLRVWRPKGGSIDEDPKSALRIRHNNQTGRWVLPFRAVWTPGADGVVVGSMKREVEVFDAATGSLAAKLSDAERMTAIASRMAVHPTRNIIAAGTASGRIHIYR